MEEDKNHVQTEESQVIREQIIPKKKNNWKRFGKNLLRVACYAVVFGVVSGALLVLSGSFLIKKLGLENAFRQVVGIGTITQMPAPTGTPAESAPDKPTKRPESEHTPTPHLVVSTPETTPDVLVTIDGEKEETGSNTVIKDETVREYLSLYSGIAILAEELEQSLVQVIAVTEGVDWFEEAYETSSYASGLYVGDNGLDMLFLVNLDRIEGATKFRVSFANGKTYPCNIFSYDTNYRLAVLSVRLSEVKGEQEALPKKAKFALEDLEVGTPVMVLGNPNGHAGAMELGMVTGTEQVVQVVDDEVMYFTTGITEYAEGDGFVFNLAGEVIGIVSDSLNKGEQGVITAANVSGMREGIENTLNNVPRIYCGMRLEAVNTVMGGKYSLPEGVYVTEVLTGSPAMYAGIKNGDIITMVGIEPVTGVRQFYKLISAVGAQNVRIVVSREAKGARKEQTLFLLPETRLH